MLQEKMYLSNTRLTLPWNLGYNNNNAGNLTRLGWLVMVSITNKLSTKGQNFTKHPKPVIMIIVKCRNFDI